MKSRAFSFSALIIWLLVFLTVLSFSIERAMMPVVYATAGGRGQGGYPTIAREVVLFEKVGVSPTVHTVFEIKEHGENSAETVVEARDIQLQISPYSSKKVISFFDLPARTVKFSSKPLQGGERVMVAEPHSGQPEDHWLVFSEGAIKHLPAELNRETSIDGTELLSAKTDYPVFAENIAKSMLVTNWNAPPEGLSVYSLRDMERFFGALPLLAAVLSLLLFALLLWAYSFRLSKNPQKHRRTLWINGGIGAALLAGITLLLRFADLPSSLTPTESIFDFSYYAQEFSRIFSALQSLSDAGSSTAAAALSQAWTMLWASFGVLAAGIVAFPMLLCYTFHIIPFRRGKAQNSGRTAGDDDNGRVFGK